MNTRLLPAELLKPELPEVVAMAGEKSMAFPWDFWRFANAYGFSCCSGAEYQPSRNSRDSRNSREPLTAQRDEGIDKRNVGKCPESLIKTC